MSLSLQEIEKQLEKLEEESRTLLQQLAIQENMLAIQQLEIDNLKRDLDAEEANVDLEFANLQQFQNEVEEAKLIREEIWINEQIAFHEPERIRLQGALDNLGEGPRFNEERARRAAELANFIRRRDEAIRLHPAHPDGNAELNHLNQLRQEQTARQNAHRISVEQLSEKMITFNALINDIKHKNDLLIICNATIEAKQKEKNTRELEIWRQIIPVIEANRAKEAAKTKARQAAQLEIIDLKAQLELLHQSRPLIEADRADEATAVPSASIHWAADRHAAQTRQLNAMGHQDAITNKLAPSHKKNKSL